MAKITKRLIDALKPQPDGRDLFVWDGDLKGFGIRLKPSGAASFIVQYRTAQARTRRLAFAKLGTLTPEEARSKARRLLAKAADGADPSSERHEAREALTVAELCDQYLEAARAGLVLTRFRKPKRASTIAIDEGRVSRHIAPLIGNKPARNLTRADVQRMSDAIAAGKTATKVKTRARGVARVTGGAGTAARVVELLGGIWSWAERRALVSGPNPARGVEKHRGDTRERVHSSEELARLGGKLREQEPIRPAAAAALSLIALTGLRRDEACRLRWSEIDFDGSCFRLAETKTGRSTRAIGKAALVHLRALPRSNDRWVFPNRSGDGPADLKKQLAAIFDAAGLKDAGAQTLRRTFATIADELGYSDATTGELLGHAKRGVTQRSYVRRPDAALVAAATRVADRIAAAMDGCRADVLPLIAPRAKGRHDDP